MQPIAIVTTGGTIDKIYFDRPGVYRIGEPQILALLEEANVIPRHRIIPLMRKDSLELTDADRSTICQTVASLRERHVIITHGTDTMVQTARMLATRVIGKVIVMTGAMQPARFRMTDAAFNIGAAYTAVQILEEGVYIAMNGRIFLPDRTRKNHKENRFEEIPPRT